MVRGRLFRCTNGQNYKTTSDLYIYCLPYTYQSAIIERLGISSLQACHRLETSAHYDICVEVHCFDDNYYHVFFYNVFTNIKTARIRI